MSRTKTMTILASAALALVMTGCSAPDAPDPLDVVKSSNASMAASLPPEVADSISADADAYGDWYVSLLDMSCEELTAEMLKMTGVDATEPYDIDRVKDINDVRATEECS